MADDIETLDSNRSSTHPSLEEQIRNIANTIWKGWSADQHHRPAAPEGWDSCIACGCWDYAACWDDEMGACWWEEEALCSHCVAKIEHLRVAIIVPVLQNLSNNEMAKRMTDGWLVVDPA